MCERGKKYLTRYLNNLMKTKMSECFNRQTVFNQMLGNLRLCFI